MLLHFTLLFFLFILLSPFLCLKTKLLLVFLQEKNDSLSEWFILFILLPWFIPLPSSPYIPPRFIHFMPAISCFLTSFSHTQTHIYIHTYIYIIIIIIIVILQIFPFLFRFLFFLPLSATSNLPRLSSFLSHLYIMDTCMKKEGVEITFTFFFLISCIRFQMHLFFSFTVFIYLFFLLVPLAQEWVMQGRKWRKTRQIWAWILFRQN